MNRRGASKTPELAINELHDDASAAQRAVLRWSWRLFRREWRQQLLVLSLITVAVAATVVGSTVATNTSTPTDEAFGSAQDLAIYPGTDPSLASQIASLQRRFHRVDVIEYENLAIPGSVDTYQLRAQNPDGPFGSPILSLTSGHYPSGAKEVAMTSGLAAAFGLKLGGTWHQGGANRQLVGLVEDPGNFLDSFALVPPGQLKSPDLVSVLFDAPGIPPAAIGPNVQTRASAAPSSLFNPKTIAAAGVTFGMLLIALMSVGSFTVIAQRRMRSLGMLASVGATDSNVTLVTRANGLIIGVTAGLFGAVLGVVLWLVYRPHLESSAHHVIGVFALPWAVVGLALVLAAVATYGAAWRPAREITKIPIVTALSGRPAPIRPARSSAVPGAVLLVVAFLSLGVAGEARHGSGTPELILGLVALTAAIILLSPCLLQLLGRVGRRAPVAVRLALRDLYRYRARSASALAAITVGMLIAVLIVIFAAARYGDAIDLAGPNLSSNQLVIYTANGPFCLSACPKPSWGIGPAPGPPSARQLNTMTTGAHNIVTVVGATDAVELETTDADVMDISNGRSWSGALYVATPAMLRAFDIRPSEIRNNADILTDRAGPGTLLKLLLIYRPPAIPSGNGPGPGPNITVKNCSSKTECLRYPMLQHLSSLPSGTSAPNTLITEHAVNTLGLKATVSGWFVQTKAPLTASQITAARSAAAAAGIKVETKNDEPTSSQVIDAATIFGIVLALCVLAMSIGLIRSEAGSDLRTLTANGAPSSTRRLITAATAGVLAFLGSLLGTVAGYVGVIGLLRTDAVTGGLAALGNIPLANLLLIVLGTPCVAAIVGWLLAGREPPAIARQPLE